MNSSFFAMMSRMKYIDRWALMRGTNRENLSEHCLQVAMIAHALCVISNVRLGNNLDPNKAALMGLYHDASEIITGDMPTPVKYCNEEIQDAFKALEHTANDNILHMLPDDMQPYYKDLFLPIEEDNYLWKLVKGADKLSAYIKCIEEATTGNREFVSAQESTLKSIQSMNLKEVDIFMDEFLSSFGKTLDELSGR